mmetsp:Transcript_76200/g.199867  ORF Transcript_76200/g.199867 Transcript_76200/m.199867 type:complete len:270 (+) Transcript_76200:964-1773(+)
MPRSLSLSSWTCSAIARSALTISVSRFTTCSSRLRASCCALWFSIACTSWADRSCILRRCLAASFSRPWPRSCSSFSWMSLRMACASFCFISVSSWAMVLFRASSLAKCFMAFSACWLLMMSSFASRASRSSSAFCSRCEALSCSNARLAWRSARNRFRAPSLFTRATCTAWSSWTSSSLRSFARVAASMRPEGAGPEAAASFLAAAACTSSSSSSSSSGVGSWARQRTFCPLLSWTKSKRSMTQWNRPSWFDGFISSESYLKRASNSL